MDECLYTNENHDTRICLETFV